MRVGDIAAIIASILLALLLLIFGAMLRHAHAQEPREGHYGHGHDPLHPFYSQWKDSRGVSCCNGTDCRPTEHRTIGERVQVKLDGEWVDVPADKIRPYASPDMGSHVCAPPAQWGMPKGTIFCVVIGSGV